MEHAAHLQRPQLAGMAKDSPGQSARYLPHSAEPGKKERCARSGRRRKSDRRCRKLLSRFLCVRRQNASRKAGTRRKFVTALCEVASVAEGVYSYFLGRSGLLKRGGLCSVSWRREWLTAPLCPTVTRGSSLL